MASATIVLSNKLKNDLLKKRIDFSADNFKAILMRSGFVFNADAHHYRANIKGSVSQTVSFQSLMILGSGFSDAGFISGCNITVSGTTSYAGSHVLISATDSILYLLTTSLANGTSLALITIVDELASGNGYSQDAWYFSGLTIGEDDASDITSMVWATALSWTAAGGNIGPTPGLIMLDDSWSAIIGYISFASAESVAIGNALVISGVTIRLA